MYKDQALEEERGLHKMSLELVRVKEENCTHTSFRHHRVRRSVFLASLSCTVHSVVNNFLLIFAYVINLLYCYKQSIP